MPVLTAHYGESSYKICLYGDFLNLHGGGQGNSIFTTRITVPKRYLKGLLIFEFMDPDIPEHFLRPLLVFFKKYNN
jgi:hypothetical protein